MKATKAQMVEDIFFEATRGKRNADNYADGMYLMDMLTAKNCADFIRYYWNQLSNAEIDAEAALSRLVDGAYENSTGVNGMTETSKSIIRAYYKFA